MTDRILNVIKQVLELKKVSETISQKNCEEWDSLAHINLVVELENEFDITLEPEEISEMTSFHAIEKIIQKKLDKE